jgi:signal transduction histidine kinase
MFPEVDLEGTITGRVVTGMRPLAVAARDLGPAAEPLIDLGIAHVGIVPLHVKDRACGCLHLARSSRPFDERELRVADTLGELLVVYLENARLYADAQARLEETAMLLDAARAVTASLDLRARLVASADVLAKVADASNAFVILVEEAQNELVITESDSRWEGNVGWRLPMGEASAAGRAILERRPIAVEDAETSPLVLRSLVERNGVKSLLALPLIVAGRPIGAAVAIETRQRRAWTAEQIQRSELIAHQIAIAVAHARLYEEVKRSYEELAQTQAKLVRRERLAALGQLAATLAHEVRNPLGVLFNSISTLGRVLPPGGDPGTLLAIMDEEARRLDRLVRELLDFARPAAPTLQSESLRALAEDALEAAARELGKKASRFKNEVSSDLPSLLVDAGMLRRALLNLLVNGAQAAGPSGEVVVRASTEQRENRSGVRLEVVDTGGGIAPEVAPRIFEPFFTTKASGTGLGLAIVKEIVEAHRGEVDVVSTREGGTTIAIFLPAS